MRAVLCERLGPPSALVLRDLPDPEPQAGEVVVKVAATALNFFDTLIIQGKYQYRPELPFSPGAEFAGTVAAAGAGVSGLNPGDRVLGYTGWGGCREMVAMPAGRAVKLPDGLGFETAAGLTVTYGTTLHALADRARLQPGETVAVLGAAGGAGIAAVEIAKLMGARVIAVASSRDKLAFCKTRGADEGIDYTQEDLRGRLKELGGPKGIDVVYDAVGGAHTEPALRALGWKGRLLVVGFAAGGIPSIPLNLVLLKGCDVLGVFWGRFVEEEPDAYAAGMRQLLDWASSGRITVPVHARYGLAETPEALEAIAARRAKGKVMILPEA
jgi:NADPH:quinone reductase